MRTLLAALLLLTSLALHARPILEADPVPVAAPQPVSAEWQVSGAATWTACVLVGSPKVMQCDLAPITAVGNYTILARFNYDAGCNTAGECWAAGAAVSLPFAYRWLGSVASRPVGLEVNP